MKLYYFDLISPTTTLPQDAYFEVFKPNANETFDAFFSRVKSKYKTDLDDKSLRDLVLASLIETTPRNKFHKYFKKVQANPTTAQMKAFAKTYARQLISRTRTRGKKSALDSKTINNRISKCLGCDFHRARASASKDINKLANSVTNPYQNLKNLDKLGGCGVCGCPLKAKVKYGINPVLADFLPKHFAMLLRHYHDKAFSRCWILEEALQSSNTKKLVINKIRNADPSLEKHLTRHLKSKTAK